MKAKNKKAAALTTACKNKQQKESYTTPDLLSRRQAKIKQRLSQIPKLHQAGYKNAVSGKSRKDGIKAFCLMCVCWQKEEVRQCTDLACPLYPYRAYTEAENHSENRSSFAVESKNNERGYIG
jgi:hypothetical protein